MIRSDWSMCKSALVESYTPAYTEGEGAMSTEIASVSSLHPIVDILTKTEGPESKNA